ncbi:hypothetical protein [Actibacterium sp. D379-3]
MYEMNARAPLTEGETVVDSFSADRATYIRDHVIMGVLGALGAMIALYWMGEVWWVGAPAAAAAISVRGFYLASDDMTAQWDLTQERLLGPQGRTVMLSQIKALRGLGSAVQIITKGGDKHLMKYLADKPATRARIEAAMKGAI